MATVNLMTEFFHWFEPQIPPSYKDWLGHNRLGKLTEINDVYRQSFSHDLFNLDLDNLQNEMAKIKSNITPANRKNTAFEDYNDRAEHGIPYAIINTHYILFLEGVSVIVL